MSSWSRSRVGERRLDDGSAGSNSFLQQFELRSFQDFSDPHIATECVFVFKSKRKCLRRDGKTHLFVILDLGDTSVGRPRHWSCDLARLDALPLRLSLGAHYTQNRSRRGARCRHFEPTCQDLFRGRVVESVELRFFRRLVLQRLEESTVKQQLLLNSEVLTGMVRFPSRSDQRATRTDDRELKCTTLSHYGGFITKEGLKRRNDLLF